MADTKTKVQVPGVGVVDVADVEVEEATERWTDVKLADGSQLRIKTIVLKVQRLEGHYDPDGNPMYQVKANQVMTITAPEHLRKGAGSAKPH